MRRSTNHVGRHIVFPFWGTWLIDFKEKYLQPTQQSYLLRLISFPSAEADIRAARGEIGLRAQPVNSNFSLRAHAAPEMLHAREFRCRRAAEGPVIHVDRGEDQTPNSPGAVQSRHSDLWLHQRQGTLIRLLSYRLYLRCSVRSEILKGYEEAADGDLIERVEAISSVDLLAPAIKYIPKKPCRILDVGAGTGRDAAWFASLSHRVVAAEPVDALRQAGMAKHTSPNITWIKDSFPELPHTISLGQAFDIVLLCAVWQHLENAGRRIALSALRSVTVDGGKVIISIRHGAGAPTRPVFLPNIENTVRWAEAVGFVVIDETKTRSIQSGNHQAGVTWTWLVLQAQSIPE